MRPHFHQLGQPPLIALAPRRDAAVEPMLLDRQLGVQFLGGAFLLGINLVGPRIEPAEADFGTTDRPAVEPEAAFGQSRQEGSVMADRDERALESLQPILKPVDRAKIEVVSRLVEQQHVGCLRQRTDDGCPTPLAAGRGRNIARQIDADLVGNRRGLVRHRRVPAAKHPFFQRHKTRHDRVLLEQDDLRSGYDLALTLVRVDRPGQAFQQSRLARAVTADQCQPVARTNMDIEPTKQPAFALDKAELFKR